MERPDPDELLSKLQRDEAKRRRGQLKIFFGASAGVGKTFAMLQAVRNRREEGVDVVIGVVETHSRPETAALLEGLEALPAQKLIYRGRPLFEFDLDAALKRKPELILVDELAHTNAAGSRHLKRWQDVEELLDAGIHVYTTVNVQHLESLNDIIGQITGIQVRETIPDHVFDLADEVTLVDLPAEELLNRLHDGKIYLPQQAKHAVHHFFRKGNLIALRELALRRTADRVDAQMREYRADRLIERIWQARERLLVCLGPGPEATQLARSAARLAASLKADWIAIYVETPKLQQLASAQRECTLRALKFAQEQGAETVTLNGADIADMLISYARVRNVSKLVVGASPRGGLLRFAQRSLREKIVQQADDIDVVLVASNVQRKRLFGRWFGGFSDEIRPMLAGNALYRSAPRNYVGALAVCAAITLSASALLNYIDLANLVMIYLLGVIFTTVRLGRGPGVLASLLSVAALDLFFVPPHLSFTAPNTQSLLTFFSMLVTSLVISRLTSSLRREARIATYRERRTSAMYAMVRELAAALTAEQIIEIGSRHVSEVFQARVAILLPDSADKVQQRIEELNPVNPAIMLTDARLDLDIAQWVHDQQKSAGPTTDTLTAARALYLPLRAPMRTRGVLALVTDHLKQFTIPEQKQLLDTFTAQIALALERVHYVEIAKDALLTSSTSNLSAAGKFPRP